MRKVLIHTILMIVVGLGFILFQKQDSFAQIEVSSQTTFDENTLDMIIVGATRVASTIREIPALVTVISGDDAVKNNYSTISDALKHESGFFYDEVTEGLQLRGQSTDDVQVLVDGVPSFNPFNNEAELDSVPMFNLDRVEVLRGASSSLFGANAVAGVISVSTREPETNQFKFKVGYGSNNTKYGAFDVYIRGEKIGIGLGYEYKKSDGYKQRYARVASSSPSPNRTVGTGAIIAPNGSGGNQYFVGWRGQRGYEKDNIWFNLKYNFTDTFSIKYNMSYYLYENKTIKPETFIHDANGNPLFNGSALLPDGRYVNFTENNFTDYINRSEILRHGLQIRETEYGITANLGLSLVFDSGYNSGATFGPSRGTKAQYPGRTIFIDFQKEFDPIWNNTFLVGFTRRQDEMKYKNLIVSDWHDPKSVIGIDRTSQGNSQALAFFVQDKIDILDNLKLHLGLRWDRYRNSNGNAINYAVNPPDIRVYRARTYTELSPKIALEFSPTSQLTFYGSYGHAFRPPDLYQVYRTGGTSNTYIYVGNPDLEPETSDTFEFGIKSSYFDTNFEFSVYQATTKGAIVTKDYPAGEYPLNPDPTKISRVYSNVDREQRRGFEINLNRNFGDYFSAFANYTYQTAKYTEGPSAGRIMNGIPKKMFNFGVDFEYKGFAANFKGRYASSRYRNVPNGYYFLSYDPHFLADVTASYTFLEKYELSVSVTNVFDKLYYQDYIAPGRAFLVTFTST
ncbi:MAG: TonB-dependent receptor, partial [Endomicrobium sp.]|nr:TonB-dependent receptor [Endomicrobium sp.]